MSETWLQRLSGERARTWLKKGLVFLLLVDVAFVFLMPLFVLLSTSLMNVMDLHDPTVEWIPRHLAVENYSIAFAALDYVMTLRNTIAVAGISAALQTISCAIVGYGFARLRFPGREWIFILVLFGLIVPPQALIIQRFILYSKLKWLDTYNPFIVPSALAMGLRGGLFIFLFRQFFKGVPWELEDAGKIDGAGPVRVFFRIILPLAQPAIVVVFLFSFVWHWNDSLEPTIYLSDTAKFLISQRLGSVQATMELMQLRGMYGTGTIMAAALLAILPLLVLYLLAQRYFVESIERTGLIG